MSANDSEPASGQSGAGQHFTAWFVDYPSTHVYAGRTVEVVPRALLAVAQQEVEDLRHALIWAIPHLDEPDEPGGEYGEDHGGATRLAWPDEPENWS